MEGGKRNPPGGTGGSKENRTSDEFDSPPSGGGREQESSAPTKTESEKRRFTADYLRQTQGGERDDVVSSFASDGRTVLSIDENSEPDVEYLYQDEHRQPYLQVVRYKPKAFRQFHWEGRWVPGKPTGPAIPYFLPSLINAAPETPIYITEGEKDADNVINLGDMEATCAPGGAGKWPEELNQWFNGRKRVFILQDNDRPGRLHARKVARNLVPLVEEVRIVPIPDVHEHGDVSDWLAMGHTREDLIALCEAAPVFTGTVIDVRGGDLVEIVNQAEATLLEADTGIYQRGNELVRAIKLDKPVGADHEVRRNAGSTMLIPVTETWALEQMARHATWTRTTPGKIGKDGKAGEPKVAVIDPPFTYARTLLAREGEWRFPPLKGVVTAPTMDREGRVIQEPGYDPLSGLLLDFREGVFPVVPGRAAKDDAVAALARFAAQPGQVDRHGLLRGFPFETEASKSVALAALLAAMVRPGLGSMPLHAFDAPTAGTGKSKLAEMAGLLACGQVPPALSQGKSPEEDEKRLSTVLHAGDPVILIDNCDLPIQGDFLCSMLTQETVQARILGRSERRILPSTALVLATGNNLTLEGDVSRRTVICRLDAKMERPDARKFDFEPQADMLADRPGFVVAALTAMRAYILANDKPALRPMGSFPDFDLIRGTLVWAGYDDPGETQKGIFDADPRKTELMEIMRAWGKAYGDRPVAVATIGQRGYQDALYQALANATGSRNGVWNAKSVGWWLRRNKDRIIGGCAFRSFGDGEWKLEGGKLEAM